MSTKSSSLALDQQRLRLERRAALIRSRLLRTIDALDVRRHQVAELGHHAKRLAAPFAATAVGVAVVAVGTAFAIRVLVERRRQRRFGYRLAKALAPLRVRAEPRLPLWQEALRKVTLTVLGIVASAAAKRATRGLLIDRATDIARLGRVEQTPRLRGRSTTPLLGLSP